ncbi:hypothetical protein GCM10023196_053670 [Actinoallomurus vinaceus]|uniref:Uncharacterized protein n=1 Tax=Actinoallomurus vinaceus TaxID=1080074 RepID=A0ABP8UE77_9ACTN
MPRPSYDGPGDETILPGPCRYRCTASGTRAATDASARGTRPPAPGHIRSPPRRRGRLGRAGRDGAAGGEGLT